MYLYTQIKVDPGQSKPGGSSGVPKQPQVPALISAGQTQGTEEMKHKKHLGNRLQAANLQIPKLKTSKIQLQGKQKKRKNWKQVNEPEQGAAGSCRELQAVAGRSGTTALVRGVQGLRSWDPARLSQQGPRRSGAGSKPARKTLLETPSGA